MAFEGRDVVLGQADVVVEDEAGTRAAGQDVLVPGQAADAGRVTGHGAHLALLRHVPDLDAARVEADGQVAAVLSELHRRDVVLLALALHQLLDVARRGVPQVHLLVQRHADQVVLRPVQQVQV